MKPDRPARAKVPNVVDGLIVLVVCSIVIVAYLRFSEPFRMARPGSEAIGEWLRVELCMPSDSAWLINESIEGFEDTDPRSGIADMRLLQAYSDSNSSTRVEITLAVLRDESGATFFRGRPLVLGMKLRFDTSEIVVEGSLCRIGPGGEVR